MHPPGEIVGNTSAARTQIRASRRENGPSPFSALMPTVTSRAAQWPSWIWRLRPIVLLASPGLTSAATVGHAEAWASGG